MKKNQAENVVNYLEANGYLEYGSTIPREVLENVLGAKIDDSWKFLGPFLTLKQAIEEYGYLCRTDEDSPGCLIIYHAEDMANRSNKLFKNIIKKMQRLQSCLTNAKTQEFESKQMRKHLFVASKISAGVHALNSKLTYISIN